MIRPAFAFDTETALFRPGKMSPVIACLTFHDGGELGARLADSFHTAETFEGLLDSGAVLYGHNVAFDTCVMGANYPYLLPKIFKAYEEDRITCTKLRQQLLDIAAGTYRGRLGDGNKWIKYGYSLDDLSSRFRGVRLVKDVWRLRYSEFIGVPAKEWIARAESIIAADPTLAGEDPQGCIDYPLTDARVTREIFELQEQHAGEYLQDQYRQARAQFALQLISNWGIRTCPDGVDQFRRATSEQFMQLRERLMSKGYIKKKTTNKRTGEIEITFSRDTAAAKARMVLVCEAEELPVRTTDGGGVCLDDDACRATGDPDLGDYADFATSQKVLHNDCEMLEKGVELPVHASFGLAETGRTTCSKPNLQNIRRMVGIRECFTPRAGKVFFQCDYPGLELFTLAQACHHVVGFSKLGEVLISGEDPHLQLAATILGITYAEAKGRKKDPEVVNARQTAKVANFGFPGGLGIAKFVMFAHKSYKVVLSEPQARQLKANWLATWSEMPHYFARITELQDPDTGLVTLEHYRSGRIRGGATFTAACNSFFQGLGSDATKAAAYDVINACYNDTSSPMFGSRIVNYVHDEFIGECDDDAYAHDVATSLADVMTVSANRWLPDVPIPRNRVEPLLMRYWSKDAIPTFDERGRLVPWSA